MNKQFEFTNDPAKLPLHMIHTVFKKDDKLFVGYYDYSTKSFRMYGHMFCFTETDVEWLVEVEPKKMITDHDLKQLAENFVNFTSYDGADKTSFAAGYKTGFKAATSGETILVDVSSCQECGKFLPNNERLICEDCFESSYNNRPDPPKKMTNIPHTNKSQSCMWCGKALSHEGLMRYLEDKPGECDTCHDQRKDSELGRAEQNMI